MKRTEKVSADSCRLGKLRDKKVKSRCVRVRLERAPALLHSAEPSENAASLYPLNTHAQKES